MYGLHILFIGLQNTLHGYICTCAHIPALEFCSNSRPPPVCLPSVYTWRYRTWPDLPGLPPLYISPYCKQSDTGGGNSMGTRLQSRSDQNWL